MRVRRFLASTMTLVVILSAAKDLSAQMSGQSFQVIPDTGGSTVGDPVTVRFRIRLHERDQPLDSIPLVAGALSPGVRIISIEKLRRSPARVYEGSARIAFYRPGRRPVPIFGLPFMRVVEGISRATLASDSAFVEIAPILSAGNPALKDIKGLERGTFSPWTRVVPVLGLVVAAGLYLLLRRRRLRSTAVAEPEPVPVPVTPSPYEIAIQRLDRLEDERWPGHGNVALVYEAVAQVLRQYLEDAHGVGALERTTSELLWALPPHLGREGLRDRCHDVLGEADLVKFAELRPGESGAAAFLRRSRQLIAAWHETGVVEEGVHAVR